MTPLNRNFAALLIWVISVTALGGQDTDSEILTRRLKEQEQARTLTRELLTDVIGLQLRQLEENGLTDLEAYRDLRSLRGNLQSVVDGPMADVVQRLASARTESADRLGASFRAIRQLNRDVARALSAERQLVLRRMRVVELTGQVQRLIQRQVTVQAATNSLPQEAQARQIALAGQILEDQRDIRQAFVLLTETMNDMRTWGGAASSAAADGMKSLEDSGTEHRLDRAVAAIASAQYAEASDRQAEALHGLRDLLRTFFPESSGEEQAPAGARERIPELIREQLTIRDETVASDLAAPVPEALVERQMKMKRELELLRDDAQTQREWLPRLEEGALAAEEAAVKLFENQPESAAAEQARVLNQLAALEAGSGSSAQSSNDRSAAELARELQELTAARQALAEVQTQVDAAGREADFHPESAIKHLAESADGLNTLESPRGFKGPIRNRLEEAVNEVRSAHDQFTTTPESPPAARGEQLRNAQTALARARAALEDALRDARRRQAAVAIGEWARAAEVLERTAAEERETASGSDNSPTRAARQAKIADVANKVAEGLAETAPEIADQVAAGREATLKSDVLNQPSISTPRDPQPSAPAEGDRPIRAPEASEPYAVATQQLRDTIAATAEALSTGNTAEAEKLAAARTAVETALQQLDPSLAARIERLESARQQVREALNQQATAAERHDAEKQQQSILSAQSAQTLATNDVPAAAAALSRAVDAGENARQHLVRQESEPAYRAQASAVDELNDAAEKLSTAIDELSRQHSHSLREKRDIAKRLSERAVDLDYGAFEALEAARTSAEAGAGPGTTLTQSLEAAERFQRQLVRAVDNLSTKEEELRRQLSLADSLTNHVREQQTAVNLMAQQRREAKSLDPDSWQTLADAMDRFAESQEEIGEGVVELSGQSEVANQALREALRLAAEFSLPTPTSENGPSALANQAETVMPEKREPIPQTEIPRAPAHQRQAQATPPDHDPLGDADDIALPVNMKADLGTGFVPKSSDLTANMMIGAELRAAMDAAELALNRSERGASRRKQQKSAGKKSKNDSPGSPTEPDDMPQQDDLAGGISQMSPNQNRISRVDNSPVKAGPLQRQAEGTKVSDGHAGESGQETEVTGARAGQDPTWSAKLPPEFRRSLRGQAMRRVPKAYEARMREYFESVE